MRQRVTRSPRQEAIAGAMLSKNTKGTGCEMNRWDKKGDTVHTRVTIEFPTENDQGAHE